MAIKVSFLIPILSSAVAVALSIALLCFGRSPGGATEHYWLSVNTSKVGQDLIQLHPASTSGSGNSSNSDSPLGDLGGFLNGVLNSIISNITQHIDNGIDDLQDAIVSNLTKALGMKDVYRLYVTKICEGTYHNASDPNSSAHMTACMDYSDQQQGLRNITSSIPDHFTLGTTNVSIPLVTALSSALTSTVSLATEGSHVLLVLLILSAVTAGLALLGSLLVVLLPGTTHRPLAVCTAAFATAASCILVVFAAAATGIIVRGASAANAGLPAAVFHVETRRGGSFVGMAWVAAAGGLVAAWYWVIVWFVEFRRTSFARRRRTGDEIGNWKGVWMELREDMRIAGGQKWH